ncbi:uncharacterized protein GGS22DRAFT_102185 [Annulohypoxylon maeteangense]|uniref:uncharacterized protein n=1 Tax=Annulohypoxylon maeteangense TaxID=1927788 RepID=UPI0020085247|nr:uncharacterized protein GGS22DRAFT_102185 [Annulohypoxylon maeteangense]KAI0879926.1 hypothetical protein GGS22DRAFT_102185 [Annulohypoxylon maeteangense]
MFAIIVLTTLLSLAEASFKTPRTALPPSPSLSSTTATSVVESLISTVATSSIPPTQPSVSSTCAPQPKSSAAAETRCSALPSNVPTSISTASAGSPEITPSPESDSPGANFHEMGVKYVQTTYWSCVTFPLETHCGWHQPILDAGAGRIRCEGSGQAALRAGIVAGVVAGGLALGI